MEENRDNKRDVGTDSPRAGGRAYGITFLCAAAVSVAYGASKDLFSIGDAGVILGYLSDAFVIPGVLLMGLSALTFVKRQGGFDGMTYCARYMSSWLLPQFWLNREERSGKLQSYRDYCADKRRRERERRSLGRCFFLVGAVFAAVGAVCLVAMKLWFPGTVLG